MIALRATSFRPVAVAQVRSSARLSRRRFVARAEGDKINSYEPDKNVMKEDLPTVEPPPPSSPLPKPPSAEGSTPGVNEVMAFDGAAPETVNGRLAMLGFIAALGAELSTGESVFSQVFNFGSQPWILYTFILFIGASLIPIFKGARKEKFAFGPFSPTAELINGRAAMIGFAALLIVEAVKGTALF